jgi:hypothetical protein
VAVVVQVALVPMLLMVLLAVQAVLELLQASRAVLSDELVAVEVTVQPQAVQHQVVVAQVQQVVTATQVPRTPVVVVAVQTATAVAQVAQELSLLLIHKHSLKHQLQLVHRHIAVYLVQGFMFTRLLAQGA